MKLMRNRFQKSVTALIVGWLALFVALRSRQVRFRQGGKLLKALSIRFLKKPGAFFWPPKDAPQAADGRSAR